MSSRKEKELTLKDSEVLSNIRNGLLHTGKSPTIREIQAIMGYKSPRSVSVIIDRLVDKGVLAKRGRRQLAIIDEPDKSAFNASVIKVPLVGLAPCGTPFLAEEHVQAMIPVSAELAIPPHKYFLLRAVGDSMDKAGIEDGDLVLVRQQTTANSGEIVVALIDSEATIKRLHKEKDVVVLNPVSTNDKHLPIILQKDFMVQGVAVRSLGRLKV